MKKLTLFICLLCASYMIHAQHVKISITEGLALDSKKNKDSLFFVKNYKATQCRIGYHYGKLGLVWSNQYIIQRNARNIEELDNRLPIFLQSLQQVYADVNTWNSVLGLELCIPLVRRKMQLAVFTGYGLSYSKSKSVLFKKVDSVEYSHQVDSKMSGSFQTGLSLNYKFNAKLALRWQNEFNSYALPFDGIDNRRTPRNYSGSQRKQLLISSLGVQYTF